MARVVPLTPALLASAYDGDDTRALVALARAARASDDSSLRDYDVGSVERFSVWLAIGSIGRPRLVFRRERAEHARWQRGLGALVDVTGSRTALPLAPDEQDVEDDAISLPYVPGRRLLALGGQRGADTTQYAEIDDIVDPVAAGAEAYYRYSRGDSAILRIPVRGGGQRVLHLREIRLHAREPVWNLAAGSLWFDGESGHLVRAVYRFAAPMNIVAVAKDADPHAFDDVPVWVRPLITPMTASLDAVTIEYSLLDGRFWLPVARYADGSAHVNMMRAPVRWEVRYRYRSVNGPDTLPRLPEFARAAASRASAATTTPPGSSPAPSDTVIPARPVDGGRAHDRGAGGATHLSMRSGAARDDHSDSAERAIRAAQCARSGSWEHVEVHDGSVPVVIRTPCDTAALARSPELPASIYDDGTPTFGVHDLDALRQTLGRDPPPDWRPQPVELRWGVRDALVRYNRIEGLSVGAAAVEELGLGLSARAEGRLGTADLEPNGELRLTRTTPASTVGLALYRRLDAATDWGDPFSVGSSVWNLLFGGDEGFYYRAWGGELAGVERDSPLPFSWRLFVEDEWTASVKTRFALTRLVGGAQLPRANLAARAGTLSGLAFRLHPAWGSDPSGFQLSADIRGEGAGGSYSYIRGAADLTVVHPIAPFADAAVTVGGGTSAGDLPAQRAWYLGGLRSVRGEPPGTQVGDAYWMTHLEIGGRSPLVRPIAFYDVGWAGSRSLWAHEGRALSGAGVGVSLFDGLVRLDIARGVWPSHGVRVNAYWQGTF